jgi:hypothetical protein
MRKKIGLHTKNSLITNELLRNGLGSGSSKTNYNIISFGVTEAIPESLPLELLSIFAGAVLLRRHRPRR